MVQDLSPDSIPLQRQQIHFNANDNARGIKKDNRDKQTLLQMLHNRMDDLLHAFLVGNDNEGCTRDGSHCTRANLMRTMTRWRGWAAY